MEEVGAVDFNANHFVLFGLPQSFNVDSEALDNRFRELQAQVHPDKFAHAADADRRLSLQWATRVNEAYQILRTPLSRAQYLLMLAGVDVGIENNTSMSPEFLMEQMEWREAVEEAHHGREYDELEGLHFRVKQEMHAQYEKLGQLLEQGENEQAADLVKRLMFLGKLLADIDEALADLEG